MSEMIDTLLYQIQFPFNRNALIVGVLIALCSSLLGVTLVLKRFSFIGDGLVCLYIALHIFEPYSLALLILLICLLEPSLKLS